MSDSLTPAKANVPARTPFLELPLVKDFAGAFQVDPATMLDTLKRTCFKLKAKDGKQPPEVTDEQLLMLMVVSKQYNLNPFLREIYAFPSDGGIVPIVGIDGWSRIVNARPELDGVEFEYGPELPIIDEQGKTVGVPSVEWMECIITIKGKSKPYRIREYHRECRRNTIPWKDMPLRMLRHKAFMQCARLAFGLGGLHDEDEGADIAEPRQIPAIVSDPLPPIPTGRIPKTAAPAPGLDKVTKPVEEFTKEYGLPEEAVRPGHANTSNAAIAPYDLSQPVQEVAAEMQKQPAAEIKEPEVMHPKWVNDYLNEIEKAAKAPVCESIGKKLLTEFRKPETAEPDKLEWFPTLFRAWAAKQGKLTTASDMPRMTAMLQGWQQYLGAVFAPMMAAFHGKGE